MVIIVAGSLILDIFSPYRFGLYLFTAVLSIFLFQKVQSINNVTDNPVYLILLSTVLYFLTHIFELFANPVLGIFIISILLNAIIGWVALYLLNILFSRQKETIKIGENVHLR